jgi:DNA-binding NarL/FixJ family response regulator
VTVKEGAMAIRVLLADDHHIIRQGLKSLLEEKAGMEVVAEADDGRAAVELAASLKPDIIVMDVGMPNLNGAEATRRILADDPEAKVVALSMHTDRRFVGNMLEAGAQGYLVKDCAFEELAEAIKTVLSGRTYLSPKIAAVVVDAYVRKPGPAEGVAGEELTEREREVLQLIAEGRSTKETALALHVSVKTIETHRRNIMQKLKVHSIAELTKYAVRSGLTTLEP